MNSRVDQVLELAIGAGVPGLSAVVTSSDGIVDEAVQGVRRLGGMDAVRPGDRFHLGSNSKAVTASLAACLVEEGMLRWDSTIGDVFADLGEAVLDPYRAVTLEQLLTHMGGVPPYTDDEAEDYLLPESADPAELGVARFARWLVCDRNPVVEPGPSVSYSNAGYAIVAAMGEAASGQSWDDAVTQRVFGPLGAQASVDSGWPASADPNQPWGHFVEEGRVVPSPPDGDYQLERFLAPAGDIAMSMPDYAIFLRAHLRGLHGVDSFAASGSIRHLHHGGQPGAGMGWGVNRLRGIEDFGLFSTHAGSAGTFVVVAAIAHDHDRAFALAWNSGYGDHMGEWLKTMIAEYVQA